MKRKPILAIALASAFAVTSLGTYAQQDEKKDEKKPYVISQSDETKKPEQSDEKKDEKKPYVISQSDETKKPEQSDEKKDEKKPYVISQSDEKEPKKPDLVSQSDEKKETTKPELVGYQGDGNRNELPYPIQSDFELVS